MSSNVQEALAGRIGEYRATGNAAVLLDSRARAEVATLRAAMGWPSSGSLPPGADIRGGLDTAVTVGEFQWLRSQVLPQADRLDDLLEAAELLTAAREIAPRSVPRWAARMLAVLPGRGRGFDHARVHDEAIDVLRAGSSGGRLAAIDHAIVLLAAAARSAAGHRDQPYYLSDLGAAWLSRFAITGRSRDLDKSVAAHKEAAGAIVAEPEDRAGLLANYSAALLAQFRHDGGSAHLQHAITAARMATELARSAVAPRDAATAAPAISGPASEQGAGIRLARLASLSRLQAALLARYEKDGAAADLDEAVHLAQEAASLVPAGDPAHERYQDGLSWLLHKQARLRTRPGTAGRGALVGGSAAVRTLPAEQRWG
jgi:hypothetical protein